MALRPGGMQSVEACALAHAPGTAAVHALRELVPKVHSRCVCMCKALDQLVQTLFISIGQGHHARAHLQHFRYRIGSRDSPAISSLHYHDIAPTTSAHRSRSPIPRLPHTHAHAHSPPHPSSLITSLTYPHRIANGHRQPLLGTHQRPHVLAPRARPFVDRLGHAASLPLVFGKGHGLFPCTYFTNLCYISTRCCMSRRNSASMHHSLVGSCFSNLYLTTPLPCPVSFPFRFRHTAHSHVLLLYHSLVGTGFSCT